MKRKLILITGGSASGKTHLANELRSLLQRRVTFISQDRFYKNINSINNYDIPSAFNFKLQKKVIKDLLQGKNVDIPIYDFSKHAVSGYEKIQAEEYIILEGIFSFFDKTTFKMADFKIFVDTPADTRLSRRILRDQKERGRNVEDIIERWANDVQTSYNKYISAFKKEADVIIPYHKIQKRALMSIVVTITHLDKNMNEILGQ